ncbi:MAG: DNA polymerase III subunit beta [Patescibacteria group bacterium]|nr:DNA polymerase III subunit beta [Patescibacteria group bacterium]
MKAIILRTGLLEGIVTVSKLAVGDALPILKNILIEAQNNKLILTATNLETAIQKTILGKVIETGKVSIPAKAFSDVISALRSERINLDQKEHNLSITSDNYHATFQGLSVEDFPIIPKIKTKEACIECKADIFKDALESVLIATEFSDLRPELNSVLLHISSDGIKLVATDSFRLAERHIPTSQFTTTIAQEMKVLIPLKTNQGLARILDTDGSVKIYIDENQILFSTPDTECISRLVEGNFPEYSGIIPSSFQSELTLEKEDFAEALKLASVFSEKNNEIKISFSKEKKAIDISSAQQGLGENVYTLPINITGDGGEVLFNSRYIHDMLRVARGKELFIGLNDESSPALLRVVGDASYCYIVKPILKT